MGFFLYFLYDDDYNEIDNNDDDDDDPFLNCFSDKDKLIQGKSSKGSKCIPPSFILSIINISIIIDIIIVNFYIYFIVNCFSAESQ